MDNFTQNLVNRVLVTKIPAVDLHDCELYDNTFFYLLLIMLDQKQQKIAKLSSFTMKPSGVSPYLTHLNISYNKLTVLPPEIKQLRQLQLLNVSHNHLKSLPITIGLFPNLKVLDVSYNELKSLPSSFAELRNHKTNIITLSKLELTGNDIEVPPKRILKGGVEAIVDYFAELLEGEDETCRSISVVCLGDPHSGKSTLLRGLGSKSRRSRSKSRLGKSSTLSREIAHENHAIDIVNFKLRGSVSKEIFDNGLLASESAISYLQSNMDSLPLNIDDLMNLFGKWQDTGKYHEFSKNISYSRYFIAEEFIEFLTNQSIINGNRELAIKLANIYVKSGLISKFEEDKSKIKFIDNKDQYIICGEETLDLSISVQAIDFSYTGIYIYFYFILN